jgi:hypothetical protein
MVNVKVITLNAVRIEAAAYYKAIPDARAAIKAEAMQMYDAYMDGGIDGFILADVTVAPIIITPEDLPT